MEKNKERIKIIQSIQGSGNIQQVVSGFKAKGFILKLSPNVEKFYNIIITANLITYLAILILAIVWGFINQGFGPFPLICGFFFGIPFSIFALIFGILIRNIRNIILGALSILVSFLPIIILKIQLTNYHFH